MLRSRAASSSGPASPRLRQSLSPSRAVLRASVVTNGRASTGEGSSPAAAAASSAEAQQLERRRALSQGPNWRQHARTVTATTLSKLLRAGSGVELSQLSNEVVVTVRHGEERRDMGMSRKAFLRSVYSHVRPLYTQIRAAQPRHSLAAVAKLVHKGVRVVLTSHRVLSSIKDEVEQRALEREALEAKMRAEAAEAASKAANEVVALEVENAQEAAARTLSPTIDYNEDMFSAEALLNQEDRDIIEELRCKISATAHIAEVALEGLKQAFKAHLSENHQIRELMAAHLSQAEDCVTAVEAEAFQARQRLKEQFQAKVAQVLEAGLRSEEGNPRQPQQSRRSRTLRRSSLAEVPEMNRHSIGSPTLQGGSPSGLLVVAGRRASVMRRPSMLLRGGGSIERTPFGMLALPAGFAGRDRGGAESPDGIAGSPLLGAKRRSGPVLRAQVKAIHDAYKRADEELCKGVLSRLASSAEDVKASSEQTPALAESVAFIGRFQQVAEDMSRTNMLATPELDSPIRAKSESPRRSLRGSLQGVDNKTSQWRRSLDEVARFFPSDSRRVSFRGNPLPSPVARRQSVLQLSTKGSLSPRKTDRRASVAEGFKSKASLGSLSIVENHMRRSRRSVMQSLQLPLAVIKAEPEKEAEAEEDDEDAEKEEVEEEMKEEKEEEPEEAPKEEVEVDALDAVEAEVAEADVAAADEQLGEITPSEQKKQRLREEIELTPRRSSIRRDLLQDMMRKAVEPHRAAATPSNRDNSHAKEENGRELSSFGSCSALDEPQAEEQNVEEEEEEEEEAQQEPEVEVEEVEEIKQELLEAVVEEGEEESEEGKEDQQEPQSDVEAPWVRSGHRSTSRNSNASRRSNSDNASRSHPLAAISSLAPPCLLPSSTPQPAACTDGQVAELRWLFPCNAPPRRRHVASPPPTAGGWPTLQPYRSKPKLLQCRNGAEVSLPTVAFPDLAAAMERAAQGNPASLESVYSRRLQKLHMLRSEQGDDVGMDGAKAPPAASQPQMPVALPPLPLPFPQSSSHSFKPHRPFDGEVAAHANAERLPGFAPPPLPHPSLDHGEEVLDISRRGRGPHRQEHRAATSLTPRSFQTTERATVAAPKTRSARDRRCAKAWRDQLVTVEDVSKELMRPVQRKVPAHLLQQN